MNKRDPAGMQQQSFCWMGVAVEGISADGRIQTEVVGGVDTELVCAAGQGKEQDTGRGAVCTG